MKAEMLKKDGCVVSFSLEVPHETMEKYEQETIASFEKSAQIKGFRPGKAPRDLIIRRFSGRIKQAILDKQLGPICHQALDQITVKPLTSPVLDDLRYELNEDLVLKARVEVAPEVAIKDYTGIPVTRKKAAASDKEVDEAIGRLAESQASFKVIEDRPLQEGDFAICDYEVQKDGQAIESRQGVWVLVGQDMGLPEFGSRISGMQAGESREIEVDLPENYTVTEAAGSRAQVQVSLTGIREKKLPEVNDAYVKKLGEGFETLDAYRDHLKSQLENYKAQETRNQVMEQIAQALLQQNPLELPPSVLQYQAEQNYQRQVHELKHQGQNEAMIKQNHEAIWQASYDQAVKQLKLEFIYDKILEKENIDLQDEELQAAMEAEARMYGLSAEDYASRLKSGGHENAFRHKIRIRKMFDRLLETAKVTESE